MQIMRMQTNNNGEERMGVIGLIRKINKTLVFTVLIGLFSAYFFVAIYENKPSISLMVLNTTDVLDVREQVEDLKIEFQGRDIQEEDLNLRIITVKIVNDGGVDIEQSRYDVNDTWGVKVISGEIIEVRLVESNSDYIKLKLNPRLVKDEGLIKLEKIIFDRGKYFVLKIMVLHEKQEIPSIMSLGKIAGIEEIEVSEIKSKSEEANVFEEIFSGGAGVQFARTISYFLVFIGLIGLALLISFGLLGIIKPIVRNSRRNEFRKFLKEIGDPLRLRYPKQLKVLSDIYEIAGHDSLEKTKYLIEDIRRITENRKYWVEMYRKQARTVKELTKQKGYDDFDEGYRPFARKELIMENDIIEQLIRNDIIVQLVRNETWSEGEDKNVSVDNEFRELLDKSIRYLKE